MWDQYCGKGYHGKEEGGKMQFEIFGCWLNKLSKRQLSHPRNIKWLSRHEKKNVTKHQKTFLVHFSFFYLVAPRWEFKTAHPRPPRRLTGKGHFHPFSSRLIRTEALWDSHSGQILQCRRINEFHQVEVSCGHKF